MDEKMQELLSKIKRFLFMKHGVVRIAMSQSLTHCYVSYSVSGHQKQNRALRAYTYGIIFSDKYVRILRYFILAYTYVEPC